jgi:hypothetical protein
MYQRGWHRVALADIGGISKRVHPNVNQSWRYPCQPSVFFDRSALNRLRVPYHDTTT